MASFPDHIELACPICHEAISLSITVRPLLTHNDNGRKGFFTATVGASGVEHTCRPREAADPVSQAYTDFIEDTAR